MLRSSFTLWIALALSVLSTSAAVWLWLQRPEQSRPESGGDGHGQRPAQAAPRDTTTAQAAGQQPATPTASSPVGVQLVERFHVCDASAARPITRALRMSATHAPWLAVHCGRSVHVLAIEADHDALLPLQVLRIDAEPPRPELSAQSAPLLSADITGDGRNDLLVPYFWTDANGTPVGGTLQQLVRDASSGFDAPRVLGPMTAVALAAGRFVGDGGLDLAFVQAENPRTGQPDGLVVMRGGPAPVKVLATSAGLGASALAALDLDDDGRDEILVMHADGVDIIALAADASVRERVSLAAPGARELVMADLDGDGRDDAVIVADALHALLSSSPAPYATRTLASAAGLRAFVAADVNGDGKLDLIAVAADKVVALVQTQFPEVEQRTLFETSAELGATTLLPVSRGDGESALALFTHVPGPAAHVSLSLVSLPATVVDFAARGARLRSAPLSLHVRAR